MRIATITSTESAYTDRTASMQPDPEARHSRDAVSVSLSRRFPIEDARCAVQPVEPEWVPDHERDVVPPELAALCRRCPGRSSCLLWALLGEERGYWAGTTSADRHRMRRHGQDTIEAAAQVQGERRRRALEGALHLEGLASLTWYRKGCRCEGCKMANTAKRAKERASHKAQVAA